MRRYFGLDPSKNWTKEELIQYDNAFMAEQDARGRLTAAEKKTKAGVVERCWRKNMDIEDIVEIAELPVEEVKKIIEKLEQQS